MTAASETVTAEGGGRVTPPDFNKVPSMRCGKPRITAPTMGAVQGDPQSLRVVFWEGSLLVRSGLRPLDAHRPSSPALASLWHQKSGLRPQSFHFASAPACLAEPLPAGTRAKEAGMEQTGPRVTSRTSFKAPASPPPAVSNRWQPLGLGPFPITVACCHGRLWALGYFPLRPVSMADFSSKSSLNCYPCT